MRADRRRWQSSASVQMPDLENSLPTVAFAYRVPVTSFGGGNIAGPSNSRQVVRLPIGESRLPPTTGPERAASLHRLRQKERQTGK